MPSNIFVTFGTLAGTEQLQTRTRTAYTYTCNCETCTSCNTCYETCSNETCTETCVPACEYVLVSSYSTNSDESYSLPPYCTQGGTRVLCYEDDPWGTSYICYVYTGSAYTSCTTNCTTEYYQCNPYSCPPCYNYDCNCQTCCTWNNWSEWTDVETCNSVSPACTNGALQRECRVV